MGFSVDSALELQAPRHWIVRYLLALAIVAAATFLRWAVDPVVHDQVPFFIYVGAVVLAAWFTGADGGCLATVVASFVGNYFFVSPRHELSFSTADASAMALFGIFSLGLVWTVGRWKRAEVRARDLQTRTETIIRELPVGVVVADPLGHVVFANSEAGRILRCALQTPGALTFSGCLQAAGCTPTRRDGSVVAPEDATVARALRGERVEGDETHLSWMDGSRTIIIANANPIRDSSGVVTGAAVGFVDITEKDAVAALASRRAEEFRVILDTVPAAVFIAQDPEARTITGNPAASELLRLTQGANLSKTAPEAERPGTFRVFSGGVEIPSDDLPVQRAARGVEAREIELDVVYDDGTKRTILGSASPLRGSDGRARGSVAAFVDVTERKRLESEVRRRMEELESIYDFAPIGLAVLDREGRFVRINRRLAEINGRSVEEHLGRTIGEVVPQLEEMARPLIQSVLDGEAVLGVPVSAELPSSPGAPREFVEQWFPIRDEAGRVTGVNVAVSEVTEFRRAATELQRKTDELERHVQQRKQIELRLREQAEELAQANRMKDEFLSVLSHELRTPLNAILGWSEMLLHHSLDEHTTGKALEAINRNGRAQAALINDVLDVSRIVSGKLRLDVRPTDVAAVVHAALDTIRPAADAKQIRIDASVGDRAMLIADPERLQQVVWNLLSNSVKFTQRGGRIEVSAREVDSQIEIRVRDTGAGISPDFLPHVFERFRQRDSSTTRAQQSGLGLGLAIVRHLTELHGGTVQAESAGEGQGAEFVVTLPVRTVFEPHAETERTAERSTLREEPPARHDALAGVRVLVVDDQPDARSLLESALRHVGADVLVCGSGREALRALQRERVDVLIADIGMPEMDGYEFMRRLGGQRGLGHTIPAIALTAFGGSDDRRRALEAGYHQHIAKPVVPDHLIAVVASLAGPCRSM